MDSINFEQSNQQLNTKNLTRSNFTSKTHTPFSAPNLLLHNLWDMNFFLYICEITPLIKLPVMSTVLFKSTAEPVSATHNEVYHNTITC